MRVPRKKLLDSVDAHVGLRVRGRRLVVGLSQTRVATALGVTFQQMQKYEKGVNRISPSRLAVLADLLVVPISFFFEAGPRDRAETTTPDLATQLSSSRNGVRLVKAFGAITNARKRAAIVALVQALADREEGAASQSARAR
jgi:transcriptional regulator with XRE-family HTH domain